MSRYRKIVYPFLFIVLVVCSFVVTGCTGSDAPPKKDQAKADKPPKQITSENLSPHKDTVLVLGRIPFTNATEMVVSHQEFLKYLTARLGVKETRLVLASDYQGIFDRLLKGEIDIAWLGTISTIEAIDNPGVKLLVKPVRFGKTSYRGIIIARHDSDIRTLKDLKGRKFAWVEKDSASGYIFPKAHLIEAGLNPDKDFSEAAFLGNHDAVVLNVLLGRYDAGACYDDARNTLRDKEKIHQLKILATTQDISNEAIVVRSDLPSDLIEDIKKAMLELKIENPDMKPILQDLTDVQGFVPAVDRDYEYTRRMLKFLKKEN